SRPRRLISVLIFINDYAFIVVDIIFNSFILYAFLNASVAVLNRNPVVTPSYLFRSNRHYFWLFRLRNRSGSVTSRKNTSGFVFILLQLLHRLFFLSGFLNFLCFSYRKIRFEQEGNGIFIYLTKEGLKHLECFEFVYK